LPQETPQDKKFIRIKILTAKTLLYDPTGTGQLFPRIQMATLTKIIQEHEQAYASLELSETIHELQSQLQQALDVASGLKQENNELKASLQDARASCLAQQRRNEEWRTSWKKEVELVSKREKQLRLDETAWNAKLAEKQKALELEEQIIKKKENKENKHGDFTNVQCDDNLSIKTENLEREVDKWRKQFFEAQKLSEVVKQMESKYLRENEITKALRKELASLLQLYDERFEKGNSMQQTKYEEKARELNLQVEAMDLAAEKLREEAREMRKSRDEAITRYDELKAKHHVEHSVSHVLFHS
jgi:chromosome segregation ATPase